MLASRGLSFSRIVSDAVGRRTPPGFPTADAWGGFTIAHTSAASGIRNAAIGRDLRLKWGDDKVIVIRPCLLFQPACQLTPDRRRTPEEGCSFAKKKDKPQRTGVHVVHSQPSGEQARAPPCSRLGFKTADDVSQMLQTN